ncbi:hypothetical protein FHX37_2878 [Haloactinospora alba]|uniref:Uncharacterized protein n=1 Tax=Haloactinospora alba TaxID=405555 RepID=A0A543NM31_9ACTN|nr:hypothetical protein [Haloactinospora alba]TQN32891.1 hypothetical protein FHX37_2878 [Haloactinospora alba]
MSAAVLLADTDTPTDLVTPGVLGFLVVAFVGAVLYFLMKSMVGKLSRVRDADTDAGEGTGDGTAAVAEDAAADGAAAAEADSEGWSGRTGRDGS